MFMVTVSHDVENFDSSKQQHIYKEMVELKSTLDEIDKGENPT